MLSWQQSKTLIACRYQELYCYQLLLILFPRKLVMDSERVFTNLDYLGSSGVVLSVEQKASLQSSLVTLKRENKFRRVKVWGVIKGVQNHYFIVQGVGKDEIKDRKALYSHNCIQWALLPHPSEALRQKASLLRGRFTGDPSFEYETTVTHRIGEGDRSHEQTTQIEMKEEDRLAAVVSRIDEEVSIVPRGAYIRTPLGEVIWNVSYQGLSLANAKRLNYYMHFRPCSEEKVTKSIDFLETLDKDVPNGSWSLICDGGGSVVILRSLQWQGMVAYNVPCTPNFGCFYCGLGEKNPNLPFMF